MKMHRTHLICDKCWAERRPDDEPTRIATPSTGERMLGPCCLCGEQTSSGIHVRAKASDGLTCKDSPIHNSKDYPHVGVVSGIDESDPHGPCLNPDDPPDDDEDDLSAVMEGIEGIEIPPDVLAQIKDHVLGELDNLVGPTDGWVEGATKIIPLKQSRWTRLRRWLTTYTGTTPLVSKRGWPTVLRNDGWLPAIIGRSVHRVKPPQFNAEIDEITAAMKRSSRSGMNLWWLMVALYFATLIIEAAVGLDGEGAAVGWQRFALTTSRLAYIFGLFVLASDMARVSAWKDTIFHVIGVSLQRQVRDAAARAGDREMELHRRRKAAKPVMNKMIRLDSTMFNPGDPGHDDDWKGE